VNIRSDSSRFCKLWKVIGGKKNPCSITARDCIPDIRFAYEKSRW